MRIIHIPILLLIFACGVTLAQYDDESQTLGEEDNLFPLDNPNTEDGIQESWINEKSEITTANSFSVQKESDFTFATTEAYQTEDELIHEQAQNEEETTTIEDTFGENSDVESILLFPNTNETESGNDAEIMDGSDNVDDYNDISENIEPTTPTNDDKSIDTIVKTGDELIVEAAQNEEENIMTENYFASKSDFETSTYANETDSGNNAGFIDDTDNDNEIENIEQTTSANDDLIKIYSGVEIIEELPHSDEENTNGFEVSKDSEKDIFSTNISTSDNQRNDDLVQINDDMKFENESEDTTPTNDDLILSKNIAIETEQTTEKSKNDEETMTSTTESYSFDESAETTTASFYETDDNFNFNVDDETEQTTSTNDDLVISVDFADETKPIANEENAEIESNSFNESIDSEINFLSTSIPVYKAGTENYIQSQTETENTTHVEKSEAQQTNELPNVTESVATQTQSNGFEEIIYPELLLPPTDIETSDKEIQKTDTYVSNNVDGAKEGLKEPITPTNVRSSKTIIDPSSIQIASDVNVDAIDVVVGETKSELNTGGVSKSLIGMIVAGMIVIVAVITVKRNWSSITKRLGSRSPTTNGRAGEQMNGKTPEEEPLKEKLPV